MTCGKQDNEGAIRNRGRRRHGGVAAALLTVLSLFATSPAQALPVCSPISGVKHCCTITSPGTYDLVAPVSGIVNVAVAAGDCISVNAPDVTLIMHGFTLRNTTLLPAGIGIHVHAGAPRFALQGAELSQFSVPGGGVRRFATGLQNDAANVVVENITALRNQIGFVNNGAHATYLHIVASLSQGAGFVNRGAAALRMIQSGGDRNGANGVKLVNTSGALVDAGASNSGASGIKIVGGGGNLVTGSANTNHADGLWLFGSSGNMIVFGSFDGNSTGIYLGCSSTGNANRTKCATSASNNNSIVEVTAGSNKFGVAIDTGNGGNQVYFTFLGNVFEDAIDNNINCGTDLWRSNFFVKTSAACIH